MKTQNNSESFLFPLSKIIIIIPIFIIVVAFYFKATENKTLSYQNNYPSATPNIQNISPTKASLKLDLNGPYHCEYSEASKSAYIYIKDKNVFASITKSQLIQSFLLKGDCLYKWSGKNGEKSCGVSQYIKLYETLSATGLTSFDTLLTKAIQSDNITASDEGFIKSTLTTCKKEAFNDNNFIIPSNVIFKEGDLIKKH